MGEWVATSDAVYHTIGSYSNKWYLNCKYGTGSAYSATTNVQNNVWQYVVAVWDKPNQKSYIYVNGV